MPPSPLLQQRISRFLQIPRPSISSSSPNKSRTSRIQTQTQKRTFQTTRRLPNKPNQLPNSTKTNSNPEVKVDQRTRLDRILAGLPSPLRKYTARLKSAPLSHVIAFLILHEITAIVPLVGLFGLFHYSSSSLATPSASAGGEGQEGAQEKESWLLPPIAYILNHYGNYVQDGVTRFEKYFTKKGWFGFGASDSEGQLAGEVNQARDTHAQVVIRKWEDRTSDPKYRLLVEIALAYAITKVLLPVRIVASVSATPWFAGVLGRARRFVSRRKP